MADSKWIDQQINALISIGVAPQDAQRSVQWVLDNVPADQDETEWIPTAEAIYTNPALPETIHDSRVEWYESERVEAKYKRVLDARIEDDG